MIEKLEKALMFSNIPGNTKESTGKQLFTKQSIELLFKCFQLILKVDVESKHKKMLKDDDIQQEVDKITQEQNKKNVITTMDVRHIVVNFAALLATSMLCHKFPILKHEINNNIMEKIEVPQPTWKYQDNAHKTILTK